MTVMRLRFLLPTVALLTLSACDAAPSRPKTSTVSVPVAAANCPAAAPAPACPTIAKAKVASAKAAHPRPAPKVTPVRRVVPHARPAAPVVVREYVRVAPHHHGRFHQEREYAAAPPPPRDYARVPQPDRDSDAWRQHQAYLEQRDHGYARPDESDRYAYSDHAYGERRHYEEHAERRYDERPLPPRTYAPQPRVYAPPPPLPRPYVQQGGGYSQHSEGYSSQSSQHGAYVERGYSEGYSEQGGARYVQRPEPPCNCAPAQPQAAGRDRYGFLTWPGKVPARP
jgi:hypothetical protein